MLKYLSNNLPAHNRFVDASVGDGKFIKRVRPSKWLMNEPNTHIHNVWKCIYDDPYELSRHVKSEIFDATCAYGNAGLYLYQRDFDEIHLNEGGFNEEYFANNIYNVSTYMKTTNGKMTNLPVEDLIDQVDFQDFVFLDDRQNIHTRVDNDYIDAIGKNGASIMILKNNDDDDLHRKFRRHNIIFLTKDTIVVTNYT